MKQLNFLPPLLKPPARDSARAAFYPSSGRLTKGTAKKRQTVCSGRIRRIPHTSSAAAAAKSGKTVYRICGSSCSICVMSSFATGRPYRNRTAETAEIKTANRLIPFRSRRIYHVQNPFGHGSAAITIGKAIPPAPIHAFPAAHTPRISQSTFGSGSK